METIISSHLDLKNYSSADIRLMARYLNLPNLHVDDLRWLLAYTLTQNIATMPQDVKIISWNILAPGLFLYFWRSSYGLELGDSPDYYNAINKNRIDNIIAYLKDYDADVVCLQEVTASTYDFLNGQTIQEYIATVLGYTVINQSFKETPFSYGYPPYEQKRNIKMDSGVATLVKNNSMVKHVKPLATAEEFGKTALWKSGIGSPFTLDQLEYLEHNFYLLNVHVRMQYPHIKEPLDEVYTRIATKLDSKHLEQTIAVGDFNAHSLVAAKELFTSDFYKQMYDYYGHELTDDHVFIGNNLRKYKFSISYGDMDMLEMNVNKPTSDPKVWSGNKVEYTRSTQNNRLVTENLVTTDHLPIKIDIDFEKRDWPTHDI